MMVVRRKQIVVLSLVLMIIVAGYLQYTYKKESASLAGKNEGKLGEAVYVDSEGSAGGKDKNSSLASSEKADEFFIQTRLNREIAREKNSEELKQITEDVNASAEVKAKAYDRMMQISANSEKEARIESLLQEEGYSDVIVIFGDDKSVDVIVKAPSLTSAQTAQIADTVSRQGNVDITGIVIRNVY